MYEETLFGELEMEEERRMLEEEKELEVWRWMLEKRRGKHIEQ